MEIWGTSRSLLAQFEVGQSSEDLYARCEIGQDSAELLSKAEIQQSGSAELFGKADVTHSVELLSKGDIRQSGTAEFLGRTEIQQSASAELLGKAGITHSIELLCNAIIKNVGSAVLYARAEVGQDSRDLLAKFEAQVTQVLYAKGVVRQADLGELYARAEVRQGSVELICRGIVRGAVSSDLKGIMDITHSIDLLGRAVIGHPAFPVWLKGDFSVGLTNAYRELGSILELRRATLVDLFGKAVVRHEGSAELLGKVEVKNIGSQDLLGKAEVKNIGFQNLLSSFAIQRQANLYAKFFVGSLHDSVVVIADDNLAEFLEYVAGVGHGFIGEPSVADDYLIKMVGENSFKITSNYEAGSYKEIKFGWKYGFVSPTPTAGVYFNPLGEIEIRDTGSLWELV